MKSIAPSGDQWRQLWRVASNVDLIVQDASLGAPPPSASASQGLLSYGHAGTAPIILEGCTDAISRLKSGSNGLGMRDTYVDAIREEFEKFLPGVSDLGTNRQQRLTALRKRVEAHAAFTWLSSTAHYPSACKTLSTLVKRGAEEYKGDATDFKLLSVTSSWMMLWVGRRKVVYPMRSDLQKASVNAKELLRFVKDAQGLYLRERLSYFDSSGLKKLASELAVLERSYKRPKEADPISEADFAHLLIRLLIGEFGSASPSIVEHLLGLIGYLPDRERVKALIRSLPPTPAV